LWIILVIKIESMKNVKELSQKRIARKETLEFLVPAGEAEKLLSELKNLGSEGQFSLDKNVLSVMLPPRISIKKGEAINLREVAFSLMLTKDAIEFESSESMKCCVKYYDRTNECTVYCY